MSGLDDQYDLIAVGSGFASIFFIVGYLKRFPKARILVLEKGPHFSHSDHLKKRDELEAVAQKSFKNLHPFKQWRFLSALGGSSNCWWACTPRMMPEDFELKTKFGVGEDWPLSYSDLETYYTQVERWMMVSGPERSPFPKSEAYPLPAHSLTKPDLAFQKSFPDSFFAQPSARPSKSIEGGRRKCCASGVCHLCPIDSKFTILNSLSDYLAKVKLLVGAEVKTIDVQAQRARGVWFEMGNKVHFAQAPLVVLGANALFNPFILAKSGIVHPLLGKRLNEQIAINVKVNLREMENFQGGSSITGHGYMLYQPENRNERAAALMETFNIPDLRHERGKWRWRLNLKFIFEEIPSEENYVDCSGNKPVVHYKGHSDYTQSAIERLPHELDKILRALPVENHMIAQQLNPTEAHILGTTVMGNDPRQSIADHKGIHHQIRNLIIMGGSLFPSSAPANPTLTLSALSLRSADLI